MAYLVASSMQNDLSGVRDTLPELWRQLRRFNLPVQLALAAIEEIASAAIDASTAEIISLAPSQPGSPDLFRWADVLVKRVRNGALFDARMNPTHTLHVVDNLAMSAFAIAHRNQAYCLGLGGSAGQSWAALEIVQHRLAEHRDSEAFILGGDQELSPDTATGIGVALLFSSSPRLYRGRYVRLARIRREKRLHRKGVVPHAAAGLCAWLTAIDQHRDGSLAYAVPDQHSDGIDAVTIETEVSECPPTAV